MNGRQLGRFTLSFCAALFGAAYVSGCETKNTTSDAAATASTLLLADPAAAVSLPGVDTSTLTPRERKEFGSLVTELLAPCPDTPVSLAQCVKEKRNCAKCSPAAKSILKAVRNGMQREQIEQMYKSRFDPGAVKDVPIDGSPQVGSDSAPITIVEFADFTCPGCAATFPLLDKLVADRKDKVRLVYKIVILSGPGHERGEPGARAALAAREQGKFWEMHHKLFENQRALQDSDLETYARQIGLDVVKFKADMTSAKVNDQIEKDRKLGDSLKVAHTPTIFINGRELMGVEPEEYIAEELGEAPAVKPTPSGSAGAPASSSASASASGSAAPSASSPSGSGSAAPKPSASASAKGK